MFDKIQAFKVSLTFTKETESGRLPALLVLSLQGPAVFMHPELNRRK